MVARAKVFGVAGFERQFAVKRFLPELTTGAAAQALSQAARSYGSLEHPRIARMSEYGVAQGQTFTAVEYVAGLDVFRLLQEAKLASVAIAAGGALALVSQAARAVGYAHGRGLSHLGLSPTNVIVTGDGDVKVTDFGILAATMPPRPAESPRLASRVPYLAPEQVSGEATSAATDVFVLGVIAYELVTGQRAYRGDTPAQVAQAILAGPPIEPALPRPIVRVLQRCLARSPFERFPDARALADALDAALRVAPVPGTRKDVGAQVKTTLERYAALNEGNVSGMVALGSNVGSSQNDDAATQPVGTRRPEARTEPSPMPTFAPTPTAPRASGLAAPAATLKDIPKPTATMTGLPPPPIPVPPGVSSPPGSPPTVPVSTSTIPGLSPLKKPIGIPSIPKPPPPTPPAPPSRPSAPAVPAKVSSLTQGWDAVPDPTEAPKPTSLTQGWDAMPEPTEVASNPASGPMTIPDPIASVTDEPVLELTADDDDVLSSVEAPSELTAGLPPGVKRPTPGQSFDATTGEMSMAQLDALNKRAQLSTSELAPVHRPAALAADPHAAITKPVGVVAKSAPAAEPSSDVATDAPAPSALDAALDSALDSAQDDSPASTMPGLAPPPRPSSQPSISTPSVPAAAPAPARPAKAPVAPPAPQSSRVPLVAGILIGLGILGGGGYYAYNELVLKKQTDDTTTVAKTDPGSDVDTAGSDSGSGSVAGSSDVAATGSDEGSASGSAGSGEAAGSDDGSAAVAVGSGADAAGSGADAAGSGADAAGSGSDAAGSAAGSAEVAATTADPNNGSDTPTSVTPAKASDQLEVTTSPAGARVFIDGAEIGKSPVKTPGSEDRHTLAVFLPDHELYLAEVDGSGVYNVTLNPVPQKKAGPGIKVETCKAKNRYYIYVDGQPSGQTCPTAKRIVVEGLGMHTVEVYDIVTETRKKYEVEVKGDRLSARVKIDE